MYITRRDDKSQSPNFLRPAANILAEIRGIGAVIKLPQMIKLLVPVLVILFCTSAFAQADLEKMFQTENALDRSAAQNGIKASFLEFLSDDSVIFRPEPINGKEYWRKHDDSLSAVFGRKAIYGDISANGMLGYTTGNWSLYTKGKSESLGEFGQFVTIWEKRPDGNFLASLDIGITHDQLTVTDTEQTWPTDRVGDPNKRGWSPADASMNFLRMSMSRERLGGAYKKFAANDVRLLIERQPPILGKSKVVSEMNRYISVEFPRRVALFQAADMAYTWNVCQYANSNEGTEKGNCLHIWKLRDKKWWIVLGVFARVKSDEPPIIKIKPKKTSE